MMTVPPAPDAFPPGSPHQPLASRQMLEDYLVSPFVPRSGHFGEFLLENRIIDEATAQAVRKLDGEAVRAHLLREHKLDSVELARWWAFFHGMPILLLEKFEADAALVTSIPGNFARLHSLLPIVDLNGVLVVATASPLSAEARHYLEFYVGRAIEIVYADKNDIDLAHARTFGMQDEADMLREIAHLDHAETTAEIQDLERLSRAKPTVRMVQNIIDDAVINRASDIHIHPEADRVDLFFRIDGQMIKMRSFSRNALMPMISRIKILGGMDIAERRLPQDGHFEVHSHDRDIDLRISVMPTVNGESAVIRILDTRAGLRSLADIGFSDADETRFRALIERNNGVILVTGPTGSGKSTTLYAVLQELRSRPVNIITVEDPVEYHIEQVTQIQVNHQIGYTFPRALRHILRHDPDIIMIGEIRDNETAQIAMQSALTGHLVLSTLHTNSAASTITRLLDIGIEPYLLNSTVAGVLAQRLLRRNCEHCLTEEKVNDYVARILSLEPGSRWYRGKGCEHCHFTGYRGRLAAYELLEVTRPLKTLVATGANLVELQQQAEQDGMVPLTRQAVQLAQNRLTSIEEVYRIHISA